MERTRTWRVSWLANGSVGRHELATRGGVAEWLKAHAWKACLRETVTWVRIPLPPPPSRRERLSVAILPRENAWHLQHPVTDLCTLERGYLPNPFSRAPLSLELCTFTWRYGFEEALKTGVL